jgi:ABC-2 type transport system permease protein
MSEQVGCVRTVVRGMPSRRGVGPVRALRSEWVKTWTLPATRWAIVAAVCLNAAIGLWVGYNADAPPVGGLAHLLTVGLPLTQVPLLMVAVVISAGEHADGSARSTYLAVPRRLPVLAAKAVVMVAVAVTAALVALTVSYLALVAFADRPGISLAHADGDLMRVLGGAVLYLVTISALGLGFGAAIRRPASSMVTLITLVLVLEQALGMVGIVAGETVRSLLPGWAGRLVATPSAVITASEPSPAAWHPDLWQGYGILMAWTLAALVVAALVVRRRDV